VPNLLLSDEPLLKSVKGTEIKWKTGRALTYRMVKKKQRGKGKNAGQVRTVNKKEDMESFFRWFSPPDMPPMNTMDEEEAAHLEEVFDEDYDAASAFRSVIIPSAVKWFTGEVRFDSF
jgi:nucleosome assembly protein 1-like 1